MSAELDALHAAEAQLKAAIEAAEHPAPAVAPAEPVKPGVDPDHILDLGVYGT
jgi:hypothetical protein